MLAAPNTPTTAAPEPSKLVTLQEELDAFEFIRQLLGAERAIGYEDSVAYFKVHLAERKTWVFARLQLERKAPHVWVPLPSQDVAPHVGSLSLNSTSSPGWTGVVLDSVDQFKELGALFKVAYESVRQAKSAP